jgi:photosystem II stability/assembly factor-like uncharacterized protein
METPVKTAIIKTYWFNKNTGFFCGGEQQKLGYIYKTTNGGLTWSNVFAGNGRLHDIYFVNDSVGYACGENMLLLRSSDYGLTWTSTNNIINSDAFFNGTLYTIFGNEKLLLIAGGNNFNVGIINWVKNNTVYSGWSGFKGINNEMRCGLLLPSQNYLVMGYGTAYLSDGEKTVFEPTKINGDFFTACSNVNNAAYFACGYNGGVYKINIDGNGYEKIHDHNRFYKTRINFNGIAFATEKLGWVVGNAGVAYETSDGKKFRKLNLKTKSNLLSAVLNKANEVVVSTSDGEILKYPY